MVGDDGELEEEFERDDTEGVFVGGFKDDGAGGTGLVDLEPAGGADAPAVAGFKAGEAVLGRGGAEVVAELFAGFEELRGDDGADGVHAAIVRAGVAAAVAVEAGDGVGAAGLERLAENVAGGVLLRFVGSHRSFVEVER